MPRRSRGCRECKQRRIGCDLASPVCKQCRITNRACSGPSPDTAIIIDQTEAVASRVKRAPPPTQPLTPPLLRQPSSREIASMIYFSHLIEFLTPIAEGKRIQPWLREVEQISVSQRTPALDVSLQAVSIVFCGVASRNPPAVVEACRMYGKALGQQSRSVSHGGGVPDLATLCTTVILSMFETVWTTSTSAYAAHLTAARRMLCLAGSELAQTTLVRDIALYIQYQTLFAMILSPSQYIASKSGNASWTDISQFHAEVTPTVMDDLMIQLFKLAELFAGTNSKLKVDSADVDSIGLAIDQIWERYQASMPEGVESSSVAWKSGSRPQNDLTATTETYFAAARMLQHLLNPSDFPDAHHLVEVYAQVVLDCTAFLVGKPIGCAILRMFFPLSLVALHSTSPKQRIAAHSFIKNWLHISEFTGLSGMVDERIRSIAIAA